MDMLTFINAGLVHVATVMEAVRNVVLARFVFHCKNLMEVRPCQ